MCFRLLAAGGPVDQFSPERQRRWIGLIVVAGIAGRLFRLLLVFPLWSDEAFLSASFFVLHCTSGSCGLMTAPASAARF